MLDPKIIAGRKGALIKQKQGGKRRQQAGVTIGSTYMLSEDRNP
jgi:hypothetical protein